MLIGVIGEAKDANERVLLYACRKGGFLIIDCANAADPHRLFPKVTAEQLADVHTMPIDLLYQFRDAAKALPTLLLRSGMRYAVFTAPHHLFSYHDDDEDLAVIEHAWELLARISCDHHILFAAPKGTAHERLARKYCHRLFTGQHTISPSRM